MRKMLAQSVLVLALVGSAVSLVGCDDDGYGYGDLFFPGGGGYHDDGHYDDEYYYEEEYYEEYYYDDDYYYDDFFFDFGFFDDGCFRF